MLISIVLGRPTFGKVSWIICYFPYRIDPVFLSAGGACVHSGVTQNPDISWVRKPGFHINWVCGNQHTPTLEPPIEIDVDYKIVNNMQASLS